LESDLSKVTSPHLFSDANTSASHCVQTSLSLPYANILTKMLK